MEVVGLPAVSCQKGGAEEDEEGFILAAQELCRLLFPVPIYPTRSFSSWMRGPRSDRPQRLQGHQEELMGLPTVAKFATVQQEGERWVNRAKVGDFFKELDITEGKSTGIPTINAAMKTNGSPAVRYEFNDTYSWFMATVPVHPVFLNDTVNETETANNVTVNDTVFLSDLSERQGTILALIKKNDRITIDEIQGYFTVTRRTIIRDLFSLKEQGILIRKGSDKKGSWMIVKKVIGL